MSGLARNVGTIAVIALLTVALILATALALFVVVVWVGGAS